MFKLEKAFVLSCLRYFVSQESISPWLSSVSLQTLNWDWIINICYAHRTLASVAYVLMKQNCIHDLNSKTQKTMQAVLLQWGWLVQKRLNEFEEANRVLEAAGIKVMLLKGIALNQRLYRDMPYRTMNDIDLLVKEDDLDKLCGVLDREGFQPSHQERVLRYRWHDIIFREIEQNIAKERKDFRKGGITLDFHWHLNYWIGKGYVEMDARSVWQEATPLPHLGGNVYLPAPRHFLSHLFIHAAHSYEFRPPMMIHLLDLLLVLKEFQMKPDDVLNSAIKVSHPSSQERLHQLIQPLKESFQPELPYPAFSRESKKLFEHFFTWPSQKFDSNFSFRPQDILKYAPSFKARALFLLGFFLPNPHYYQKQRAATFYFTHWFKLAQGFCKQLLKWFESAFVSFRDFFSHDYKRSWSKLS